MWHAFVFKTNREINVDKQFKCNGVIDLIGRAFQICFGSTPLVSIVCST